MTVKRMDNVGIVVEDLDAAIEFFTELGLELEGRAPIEGEWAGRVTGLRDQRVELVGEVVQYEDTYRLCYIRGPEGILIGLAEELSLGRQPASRS
jgi:hypothetical protein